MKNVLLIISATVIMLVSCSKDRTCECTVTHTNYAGTFVDANQITTYKNISKSDAKNLCQNKTVTDSSTSINGSGTYGYYVSDKYECKLK